MVNKFGTSDDWVDGDVLNADNLLDTFGELKWSPFYQGFGLLIQNIIVHSSTTWSALGIANIKQSSDTGVTWTSRNTDLDGSIISRKCKADATYAFSIELGSTTAETALTDDSGATWTTKTSGSYGTEVYDLSVPTTSLIVVAGDDGGGANHITYSTDDGATWSDPTTPPGAACHAVDMYDGTTGYAIDSSNNIWKTTDGGDTWVDTTDDAAITTSGSILAISETLVIICDPGSGANNPIIRTYDNSTNTVTTKLSGLGGGGYLGENLGIIKLDNGDIIIGFASPINLFKSTDNGSTWKLSSLPSIKVVTSGVFNKGNLSTDGTDVYLSNGYDGIIKISMGD